MQQKFNLALIPMIKEKEIIQIAQNFSSMASHYLLGRQALPHVTLYQFRKEATEIKALWHHVCQCWQQPALTLTFDTFSYVTFDQKTYWISLMPNQRETLYHMHALIAELLQLPIKPTFDPHMTLLNTKNQHAQINIDKIASTYQPIQDQFILALGRSGGMGQLQEIIYRNGT